MNTLVLHTSATAQWHALINDAEHACQAHLEEDLQSYLVFLLMRYVGAAELSNTVMALDYLNSFKVSGRLREHRLREVGDKCLLYSGFFPGRAERRRVRISYYVDIGVSAYALLATSLAGVRAQIFEQLSAHFIALMDILQAVRQLGHTQPILEPLQAMELWQDTHSNHALTLLSRYTQATPVHISITETPTVNASQGKRSHSH